LTDARRSFVVGTMNGTAGAEENAMFDSGFATIFHPALDATSAGSAHRNGDDAITATQVARRIDRRRPP